MDDEEEKESEIKSDREVLQMAEKLHLEYARFREGNEKLSQSSIFGYFKK